MRNSTVKGFTLIELIVVIAIIGVLAAILVPSMIGYLSDSKLATANTNAKLSYENVATLCTKLETAGYPITASADTTVDLTSGSADTITPAGSTYSGMGYIESELPKLMQQGHTKIGVGESGFPYACAYAKTTSDVYVGAYPTATVEKQTGATPLSSFSLTSAAADAEASGNGNGNGNGNG